MFHIWLMSPGDVFDIVMNRFGGSFFMASQTKVSLSTLSYVIIYVKDTDKSVPFYKDTLGMKVKVNHPGWVELETGSTTLALHGEDPEQGTPGTGDRAVMVFGVDNVHEAYDSLKAGGVKFEHGPHEVCEEGDKVGMSADFRDPDGNLLSIFSYVAKK